VAKQPPGKNPPLISNLESREDSATACGEDHEAKCRDRYAITNTFLVILNPSFTPNKINIVDLRNIDLEISLLLELVCQLLGILWGI
jgi:hypothetical protein